jgi:hypothetical protein
MEKSKSVVALNDPKDALEIFRQKLLPFIVAVRNKRIDIDLGDYAHIILDHPEMQQRVAWIEETLKNPEEIRQHPDKSKLFREIYLNRIYLSDSDAIGMWDLVFIDARPFAKLWASFIPTAPDYVTMIQKRGKLVWKNPKK